uniref:Acyl-CoA thioesterase 9 n=1 Tax=Nothobranchius furzeri TaxID=105023 RepID=A0A8C6VXB4_NOTFU
MLSPRLVMLRSAASMMSRSLCAAASHGRAADMADVRNRLREIVGASTNWSDHQQAMAERTALSSMLAKSQSDLPAKRMQDSFLEVHLPLGSEPQLREKYLTYHNTVRFGRILEDLDSLAVLISYSHTYNPALRRSPLSIVTALVDKIDMRQHVIYPDCDIKFTGHVTWVGKTSIEAKMHMSQVNMWCGEGRGRIRASPLLIRKQFCSNRRDFTPKICSIRPSRPAVPRRVVRPGSGRYVCHGGPRPGKQKGGVCKSAEARRRSGGEAPPGGRNQQTSSCGAEHGVAAEGRSDRRGEEDRSRPVPQHSGHKVRPQTSSLSRTTDGYGSGSPPSRFCYSSDPGLRRFQHRQFPQQDFTSKLGLDGRRQTERSGDLPSSAKEHLQPDLWRIPDEESLRAGLGQRLLLRRVPTHPGGRGRHSLPETRGDRLLVDAVVTGVLHSGEVHPGQSSQRGV